MGLFGGEVPATENSFGHRPDCELQKAKIQHCNPCIVQGPSISKASRVSVLGSGGTLIIIPGAFARTGILVAPLSSWRGLGRENERSPACYLS